MHRERVTHTRIALRQKHDLREAECQILRVTLSQTDHMGRVLFHSQLRVFDHGIQYPQLFPSVGPTAIASFIVGGSALAESDAQIKAKILGYWLSPRHAYLIQANGLMRMCPTTGPDPATTANRWDVRSKVAVFLGGYAAMHIIAVRRVRAMPAFERDALLASTGRR